MYTFSQSSILRMKGVDERLVRVAHEALRLTTVDFSVSEGLRQMERQKALVKSGASKTLNSKHLTGKAIDVVALTPEGKADWRPEAFYPLAVAFRQASINLGVEIVWGGIWDRPMRLLSEDIGREVTNYIARRRAVGRTNFFDGPHFELA